jgi:tetratricopeptide (TPR) repeat protein
MDEDAYRAVGATLSYNDYHEKAVEYFLKAGEHSKTPLGKFYSLVALGRSYFFTEQYKEAETALNSALAMQEEMLLEKENPELVKKLLRIAYKKLGRTLWAPNDDPPRATDAKKAIHAYEQAILFGKDESVTANVALVDKIYKILVDVNDPKDTVDKVCSWDTNLCTYWLLEDLEYETKLQAEFQKAAKLEDRVDDMIKCYKAAIETTPEKGDSLLIQVELGSVHWKVLENEDLAYEELHRVIDTTDMSQNAKHARHRASVLLSEMMYGRIKLSPTVWMRRILAANLAVISQKDTESGLDAWNIRPNISLAAAYLACNQRNDAVQLLDSTFSLCLEWLRDDVSWNDVASLRMLAKLLACVGLHRDAAIACSATFSKLDKDPEPEPEPEPEQINGTTSGGANANTSSGQKDPVDNSVSGDKQPVSENSETMNSDTEAAPPIEPEKTPTEEASKELNRLIPDADEERLYNPTFCNGCGKTFDFWVKDEPFYMCLICQNMDLCKECHAKRMALNMEGGSTIKLSYCGMHHDYVKAPIEGWGGIKSGIMSVAPEKVEFRHWLKDVEERRGEWKESGTIGA